MRSAELAVRATGSAERWIAQLDRQCSRREVAHQGLRLAWRVFGQGPKVLLLHGGHGSWLHWAHNLEALAQHHEVHVPDMPGYGESDTLPVVTLDALVAVMQACMDQLFDEQAPLALVGFSFGGLVAAHLAVQRKGPTALALLGPAGHGGPRRARGRLQPWRQAVQDGDHAALAAVMRHNLLIHMLHQPDRVDDLALSIHSLSCQRTRFVSKPISHAGGLSQALAHYNDRLLLLFGEHDVTTDPSWVMQNLFANRPGLDQRVFQGYGHWVQYEAAALVNSYLLQWLARASAPIGA